MELTLKNFASALPKKLLHLAEKNVVRECDETNKGQFVAYVDEGNDSFDVSLTISNNTITKHACDCNNGNSFCRHKTALLLHIASNRKIKPSVKAKNKSKSEALLEEAEISELKEWVKELLQKNKDIELSFIHSFSGRQQQYKPEEVQKLTADAFKAVVKNKKNVDATQLKKIVDLWSGIHAPIVKNYLASAWDEKAFTNVQAFLDSCQYFQSNIYTTSNKIPKYVESVLQQSVEIINNIIKDDAWRKAVDYYISHIQDDHFKIRMHYVHHLKNVISISIEERKKILINALIAHYSNTNLQHVIYGPQYTKALFEIVCAYGVLADNLHLFKPMRFENEFNKKLIRLLLDNQQMELAETYSRQQIENNYREEYNLMYLEFLKEIYTIQNNEAKLAEVLAELFPRTFDFDDYLFIYNHITEEDKKKKWRTNIKSRAKNASNNLNRAATVFYFRLLAHESNYLKMIDAIDDYTPFSIILSYFDPMAQTDKVKLLKAILDKNQGYGWAWNDATEQEDQECFPKLYEAVLKYFTTEFVISVITKIDKNLLYYKPNNFALYLKQQLFFQP